MWFENDLKKVGVKKGSFSGLLYLLLVQTLSSLAVQMTLLLRPASGR